MLSLPYEDWHESAHTHTGDTVELFKVNLKVLLNQLELPENAEPNFTMINRNPSPQVLYGFML